MIPKLFLLSCESWRMKSSNSSPLKTLIDWSFSSCSQNFRAQKRAETSPQIALKSVCSSARWCPGCQRISALTFAAIEQRIRNVKIVYVCVSVCVPHSVFHEKKAIFLIYFFIFPANCIRIFSSFSCLQLVFPLFFWCCHFSGFVVAHCSNVFCIFYGTCNTTTSKFVCVCVGVPKWERVGRNRGKVLFHSPLAVTFSYCSW